MQSAARVLRLIVSAKIDISTDILKNPLKILHAKLDFVRKRADCAFRVTEFYHFCPRLGPPAAAAGRGGAGAREGHSRAGVYIIGAVRRCGSPLRRLPLPGRPPFRAARNVKIENHDLDFSAESLIFVLQEEGEARQGLSLSVFPQFQVFQSL